MSGSYFSLLGISDVLHLHYSDKLQVGYPYKIYRYGIVFNCVISLRGLTV